MTRGIEMVATRRKGFAALLTAVFIWASTFVATKDALLAFPAGTLAVLRFVLALVVLFPLYLRRRPRSPAVPVKTAVLLGFFGVFLYFALQNWGLLYCRASTASLLMASVPAFTALASHLFLREKIGPARVTGILASMGGIAMLVWSEGNLSALATFNPGSILLIGAAVAWAVYTILGRKLSSSHDPAVVTLQSTVWGILFLLPIALLEKQPSYQGLGLKPWAVLLYLGLIASGLPIFLWNYALKTFDASEAGVYLNLVPVVATALAVPLLGERLGFSEVAAGLMIITGVMLAQGKGRGSAGAEPPKTAGGANRHIPVSLNITRGAERDIEACLAIARNLGEYFTPAACRQMAVELAEHPFYIAPTSTRRWDSCTWIPSILILAGPRAVHVPCTSRCCKALHLADWWCCGTAATLWRGMRQGVSYTFPLHGAVGYNEARCRDDSFLMTKLHAWSRCACGWQLSFTWPAASSGCFS